VGSNPTVTAIFVPDQGFFLVAFGSKTGKIWEKPSLGYRDGFSPFISDFLTRMTDARTRSVVFVPPLVPTFGCRFDHIGALDVTGVSVDFSRELRVDHVPDQLSLI
jgi:hypothetical protein